MIDSAIHADLIAVLVAVTAGEPRVLTIDNGYALPAGPLQTGHISLQAGLHAWVEQQTHHSLGYVEQLYTFSDQKSGAGRSVSISYLALSREKPAEHTGAVWRSWYDYFPWEDTRQSKNELNTITSSLVAWAAGSSERMARVGALFNVADLGWNEELVLQRYEILWEAGLVPEALRHNSSLSNVGFGQEMTHDHRRILATAIARLRAKIKYRPVVFELLPNEFTLLELQHTMEALAGRSLHKPNFRRLIEQQDLVEETGRSSSGLAGRPAKLFRFRAIIRAERGFIGSKLPVVR